VTITRSEIGDAVRRLKRGKATGIDDIPGELIQAGGKRTIDVLHKLSNVIWKTGKWPQQLTHSVIIPLPEK